MNAHHQYQQSQFKIGNEMYVLDSLAEAFNIVGNSEVAETLYSIAEIVRAETKNIGDAYAKEVNKQLLDSSNQLGSIIETILESKG